VQALVTPALESAEELKLLAGAKAEAAALDRKLQLAVAKTDELTAKRRGIVLAAENGHAAKLVSLDAELSRVQAEGAELEQQCRAAAEVIHVHQGSVSTVVKKVVGTARPSYSPRARSGGPRPSTP
jgi:hypothetical protein